MILRFVLWNLADSKTTVQELRRYLQDEAVDALPTSGVPLQGLDRRRDHRALGSRLPVGVARSCRGRRFRDTHGADREDPDIGETFDVEATIEGRYLVEDCPGGDFAFEDSD